VSALDAAVDATLTALLTVEQAGRVRLASTVRRIGRQVGAGADSDTLIRGSHAIERGVLADVLLIRSAARRASSSSLTGEMKASRIPVIVTDRAAEKAKRADYAEATTASKAFAAAWLSTALATAPGDDGDADAEPAEPDDLVARGEGLATTQAASAFAAEREDIMRAHAREARARGLVIPFKRWDATHDRRLCARCRDLSGAMPRPWGVAFPGGIVPGTVHPRCRCVSVTAVMPLAWKAEVEVTQ
jgi:hypothetical protein